MEVTVKVLIRDMEGVGKYGKDPWNRPLEELLQKGIVVIDKPAGPTSHQVTSWVKRMLEARKAGHSGTLDPGVTGVLPIVLNDSTKIVPALLKAGKEYVGVMYLHGDVEEKKLKDVVKKFEGEITQLPPARSAVKRDFRQRTVYYLNVLGINGREVLFKTAVQAGTYIRKLCHDIGEELGVGANMKLLRRVRAGPFTESTAATMHELHEAWGYYKETGDEKLIRKIVRPIEDGVLMLPKVYAKDSAIGSITHGAKLGVNGVSQVEESFRVGKLSAIMNSSGELVAIGNGLMNAGDTVKLWEGNAVKTDRVVMEKDRYPRTW